MYSPHKDKQVIELNTSFVVIDQRQVSDLNFEIAIAGGIASVDSRSGNSTQCDALCRNPIVFLEVFGSLAPTQTYFMYENLVLELWYDVKKLFIVDARTYNSAS